jgi:hypothetical protein
MEENEEEEEESDDDIFAGIQNVVHRATRNAFRDFQKIIQQNEARQKELTDSSMHSLHV